MTPEQIEKERQAFEKWLIASGLIATNHEFSIACKWFKEAKRYNSDLVSGLFNVWLARSLQPAWISVNDRLPQLREDVLVAWSNGEIGFARRFNPQNNGECWDTTASNATITHWQPLPEPPKAA